MRRRSRITAKVVSQFHWNLMLWLFLQREESIKFWWWSGPGYRFRFIFLFHQHCVGEYGIFKITGCFSRTSVKWLVPTMEWIHYVFGQIQQIPDLDRSKTSVFKYQITFGWGSQSSRGEEICLHWQRCALSGCRLALALFQLGSWDLLKIELLSYSRIELLWCWIASQYQSHKN